MATDNPAPLPPGAGRPVTPPRAPPPPPPPPRPEPPVWPIAVAILCGGITVGAVGFGVVALRQRAAARVESTPVPSRPDVGGPAAERPLPRPPPDIPAPREPVAPAPAIAPAAPPPAPEPPPAPASTNPPGGAAAAPAPAAPARPFPQGEPALSVCVNEWAERPDGPLALRVPLGPGWRDHQYLFFDPQGRPIASELRRIGGTIGRVSEYEYRMPVAGIRASVSADRLAFEGAAGARNPGTLASRLGYAGVAAAPGGRDRVLWFRSLQLAGATARETGAGFSVRLPRARAPDLLLPVLTTNNLVCRLVLRGTSAPEAVAFTAAEEAGELVVEVELDEQRRDALWEARFGHTGRAATAEAGTAAPVAGLGGTSLAARKRYLKHMLVDVYETTLAPASRVAGGGVGEINRRLNELRARLQQEVQGASPLRNLPRKQFFQEVLSERNALLSPEIVQQIPQWPEWLALQRQAPGAPGGAAAAPAAAAPPPDLLPASLTFLDRAKPDELLLRILIQDGGNP